MKALKHIALLFIALITVSSCDNDDIYEETWFVKDFEVKSNHWELIGRPDQEGSYYQYVFNGIPGGVPYYDGITTAYLYFGFGTSSEVQTPLPYTEYLIGDDGNGNEVFYSIQYSYDVKADGTIAFKAHVSDYYTASINPGTQVFRVAIVW